MVNVYINKLDNHNRKDFWKNSKELSDSQESDTTNIPLVELEMTIYCSLMSWCDDFIHIFNRTEHIF